MKKRIFIPAYSSFNLDDNNSHYYIGSHTCINNLPDLDLIPFNRIENITLISPPVPQSRFEYIKEYIMKYIGKAQKPEIVFNDWGVFYWSRKNNITCEIPLIMGFILSHQYRDPFELLYQDQVASSSILETREDYVEFFKMNGIESIEITSTLQGFTIPEKISIAINVYRPYSFLSFTRYCPYLRKSLDLNDNRIIQECEESFCRYNYHKYELRIENQKVNNYYIGNAQWYKNEVQEQSGVIIIDNAALLPISG